MNFRTTFGIIGVIASLFFGASMALGAKVHSCSQQKKMCTINSTTGQKGDYVKIQDHHNRTITVGIIVKKTSRFARVRMHKRKPLPKHGDMVIIMDRDKNSPTEWAGAFSFDK